MFHQPHYENNAHRSYPILNICLWFGWIYAYFVRNSHVSKFQTGDGCLTLKYERSRREPDQLVQICLRRWQPQPHLGRREQLAGEEELLGAPSPPPLRCRRLWKCPCHPLCCQGFTLLLIITTMNFVIRSERFKTWQISSSYPWQWPTSVSPELSCLSMLTQWWVYHLYWEDSIDCDVDDNDDDVTMMGMMTMVITYRNRGALKGKCTNTVVSG